MPPKVLMGALSTHGGPPVPVGAFQPGPNTPEAEVFDPAVIDTGQFRFFQNEAVTPAGASTSTTGEPSIAQTDHVMFQTGNWYAAVSRDNGASWDHVNPYTFFPSRDGGFCCDQRVVYIPSHDITVWVLQYSYSAASGTAGYRIAVANGDTELGSGNSADWTSYYITPQNRFGFGTNVWFDFPDIAYSDDGFYLSANVFDSASPANYVGTAIIRTDLSALQANGSIPLSFINSISHGVGFAPRMAKAGVGDGIHWGCLDSTSSVQVGFFSDMGTYNTSIQTIGSVTSGGIASTPSPDGVNWAARANTRFRGAFGSSGEFGLMFTSGPVGTRTNPFIRVVRINPHPARTVASEVDIWNSTGAWAYGAAATNAQGHVGIVVAYSSSTVQLQTALGLVDNYSAWPGSFFTGASGTTSPNQPRWGDYFTVQRHSRYPDTFVATGMSQRGGSTNADNTPRAFWFGRDDYEPTWVTLAVESSPVTGVPITVEQTDMDGRKDGSANFSRRFAPSQPYTLTAPATFVSGLVTWEFERWRYRVSPTGGFVNGTLGDRVLSVSTIGGLDDTAIADYRARRSLTVQSTNPPSGVSITMSPADINGLGNGSTTFSRTYLDGEVVTLTAPASVGFNDFRYWRVNGVLQIPFGRTLNLTMDGIKTAVATYFDNVSGTSISIGAGCTGSNGLVPVHYASWLPGQNGPQQGSPIRYELALARSSTPAAYNFGLSNSTLGGLPLPLDLAILNNPGCFLYHNLVTSVGVVTNALGQATVTYTWPVDAATIGVPHYTSYLVVDPGNGRPAALTLSNAHETRVGGNR
ncbi:MAG: hypothetical protein ACO4CT_11445 [Planctomycetota bacterium]